MRSQNSYGHRSPDGRPNESDFSKRQLELERFKNLVESTTDWLWEVDKDLHYTYSSPQVYDILGYTPEEVIGKTPFDFMTAEEVDKNIVYAQEVLKSKRHLHLHESIHLHKDGHPVYIETSGQPFFDDRHGLLGYRGIDRDVTTRVNLETEHRQFSDFLDQIDEAALIIDMDWRITYVNPAFHDCLGYTRDEILNQHISRLNPANSKALVSSRDVIECLDRNGVWEGETVRKHKNGRGIPVYLKAKVLKGADGEIHGYLGTYFNLTPYKQAEKRLRHTLFSTIDAIANMVEKRDPYTFGHQNRVAKLSVSIAGVLNKGEEFIKGLEMGALIHDIGKMYIPAEILNRPGTLSEHEMGLIKTHPGIGYDIVKDVDFPWPVAQMILQHHERLDGTGYPNGLKAPDIIDEAKILAVADVIEAMTSHRPYRPALDMAMGIKEIEKNRGILYDPDVVDACIYLCMKETF